ncbi:hypothetical protein K4K49_012043 [Colletotrichum sp. SAR 10_70]|nr:hypothetical protein K4K50_012863 [Colletotrichum sp. SAR 10_71]KAI8190986.1 hypothetical protein K4K49_012043 [Colletotrichum sp. SAR 10_70]KAI8192162.1 hypothetical protein K4K51_006528 [Colletotrichum sp. SAR 10_75]
MATTTFHRFLDLPAELRLQIWESVAYTAAQPRIHFMPIGEYTEEAFDRRWISGLIDLDGSGQADDVEIMPKTERSWVKDNDSAYLIDAGISIRRRRKSPENPGSFDKKYRSKGRTFGVVKGLRDVAEESLTSGMNAFNFLEAIGSVEGYWTWEKTNFAGISRSYYLDPEEAIPVLAITDEEDVGSLGTE